MCVYICKYTRMCECMYGNFSNTIWYIFVLILIFVKSEFLYVNSVHAILTIKKL